ncbi:MAG: cation-transporting P-type ATPase, partial [Candidatus Micrarchaeia archaeon]
MAGLKEMMTGKSLPISQLADMEEGALLAHFRTGKEGLSHSEARRRHLVFGYNEPEKKKEAP